MERRDSGLLALGRKSAGDWRSGLRGQEAQARGGGVISVIENEWGGGGGCLFMVHLGGCLFMVHLGN